MLTKAFLVAFISFLNVGDVLGKTLVPIRPGGNRNGKRQEQSGLDLVSTETFRWGDEDGAQIASLTVDMPGDNENILSMEHFDGMVTAITCSNSSISMTFEDDATFAYAQRTWDWVNGADNHSFVMVAGRGDCGNNTDRIPFVISTLQYDEVANTAVLNAQRSDWQTIAHSYDLVVGSVGQGAPESKDLQTRDITKSTSIDFNHDLGFSVALSSGALEARLACTNCSTTGKFDLEFRVSQKFFVPMGASMKISPNGVSAIGQIKLSGSGSLVDSLTKTFDIVSIPVSALDIPGILELGPFLKVAIGASLSPLSLSGGIQSGAKATLSNDAVINMNLLNPAENTFSGWMPSVEPLDVSVDASVTTSLSVFLQPSVELRAEALGKGFEIGLNMKIPNVSAKISAITSSTGVCTNVTPKTNIGVKIGASIGAQLNIQALRSGKSDPLFTVQLAALDKPIAETCFPFGKPIAKREIGHPHVRRETINL